MVKYTDILKAINSTLKKQFPKIPIQSKDITEGFLRPSFFVRFRNMKQEDIMDHFKNRKTEVRIYYFPEDRYKNQTELFQMADELEGLFQSIEINEDFVINIDETETTIVDGVLNFAFDIETIEVKDKEDTTPNLEDLEINIRKG